MDIYVCKLSKGQWQSGQVAAAWPLFRPIWLPFNLFDQLLLELKEHSDEHLYQKHYTKLNGSIDNYMQAVKRVSQDMITVARIS